MGWLPTGGCINASPAGKRRIAAAAEQQQFGSSYGNSGGLYGNLLDDTDGSATGVNGLFSRVGSPLTTITAIAVAACLLIVTVFAVIFAVLQVGIYTIFVCIWYVFNKDFTKIFFNIYSPPKSTIQLQIHTFVFVGVYRVLAYAKSCLYSKL